MFTGDLISLAAQLTGLLIAVGGILWLIAAHQGDKRWVTRQEREKEDWVSRKEYAAHESAQALRLAEVVVEPMRAMADEMKTMAITQQKTLEGQVRQEEINKSIGRSLDDLRDAIHELRGGRAS